VRESNLNLRDGPGTHYVSMEALDAGISLALIEKYQEWVHVATNDFDGWVKSSFLDVEKSIMQRVPETEYIPDPNPALVGSVVDDMVNLREGPGKVYHTLGNVNADATVDLLARHGDWFKVQLRDGTVAWIFSDLLYISPMARRRVPYTNDIPAEPQPVVVQVASNSSSSGGGGGGYTTSYESSSSVNTAVSIPASGDVASYAAQFVGYPYVYGGASPGSGFDCSGLVQYVYRQYGVYLPRVAAAQYSTAYGAAVGSMSNLAPGDLMFFAGTAGPGISHVAIYIGGGSMVHAMTPGLGVGVSNIWEGYWVSHYYGAIRPYR
jgi:cell wall-associated NlpC family hydrolase